MTDPYSKLSYANKNPYPVWVRVRAVDDDRVLASTIVEPGYSHHAQPAAWAYDEHAKANPNQARRLERALAAQPRK